MRPSSESIRRKLGAGLGGSRQVITGFTITRTEAKPSRIVTVESGWILVDGVRLRQLNDREAINWWIGKIVPNLYSVVGGNLLFNGVIIRPLTYEELGDWIKNLVIPKG